MAKDNTQMNIDSWLTGKFDQNTKKEILRMQEEDPAELSDAFYRTLEFGTGGMRGILGVGTNRMNKYTVGFATQGLANYLIRCFKENIKVAISFDSRNGSTEFANIAANILAANEIQVYLFDSLRPTPELSFAVRHLQCNAGIMITASHNPKEYNGYKVYWNDGGQLVPPHDKNVINEVNKIKEVDQVKWDGRPDLIRSIGKDIDNVYLTLVKRLSLHPEVVAENPDLCIVYTPLHGTGISVVPQALADYGFKNVHIVEEQAVTDGNFPTVKSPNPEESAALELAVKLAKKEKADIVLATDPDADRVGIAVRGKGGKYQLFNGNQTADRLQIHRREDPRVRGQEDLPRGRRRELRLPRGRLRARQGRRVGLLSHRRDGRLLQDRPQTYTHPAVGDALPPVQLLQRGHGLPDGAR